MDTIEHFSSIATSFPGVSIQPHFEKKSFRAGKKIFATLDEAKHVACLKLSVEEQDVFCAYDKNIIYPVPNKWGKQGWTFINLQAVPEAMLSDALRTAYCSVAPSKLAALVLDNTKNNEADVL